MISLGYFFLGRAHYQPVLTLQKQIVNVLNYSRDSGTHAVLLLEHSPVYTVGIRSNDPANDYSESGVAHLKQLGADFIRSDRGGLITYHGPGQLVAYPIIDLRCKALLGDGLRWYVNALEQAGVELCKQFGLNAHPGGSDIGVWLEPFKKVMAIGVHKSNSVTYHGLALNCSNEPLAWLRKIVPCGLIGRDVTSLSEACGRDVTVPEVLPHLVRSLTNSLFGSVEVRQSELRVCCRTDLAHDWTVIPPEPYPSFGVHAKSTSWDELVSLVLGYVNSHCMA